MRQDWARAWSDLIAPGGELVTLIFPVGLPDWVPNRNPPWEVTPELYQGLLLPAGGLVSELGVQVGECSLGGCIEGGWSCWGYVFVSGLFSIAIPCSHTCVHCRAVCLVVCVVGSCVLSVPRPHALLAGFEQVVLEPVPEHLSHKPRAGREWLGRWRRVAGSSDAAIAGGQQKQQQPATTSHL